MYVFLIVFQVIVAVLLIVVILIQQGRGGGLVESLSGVDSIFGAKTNVFLVRITAVLATLFLLNSLILTYLSTQMNKSLMERQSLMDPQDESTLPQAGDNTPNVNQEEQVSQGKDQAQPEKAQKQTVSDESNTVKTENSKKEEIETNKSQSK